MQKTTTSNPTTPNTTTSNTKPVPSPLKKTFALLYSATSYLLFLGAFTYLIAFTMNLAPHSISGQASVSPAMAAMIDTLLITLFGLQHSIMARPAFKRIWTRVVPQHLERSTFVLMATGMVTLIVFAWQPIEGTLWNVSGAGMFALSTIAAIGWTAVPAVSFLTDHFELFGLRQAAEYATGQPESTPEFKQPWAYKQVRHPMMLGMMIAMWATPLMTAGHLLFAGLMTIYILIGTAFEEQDLATQHGDAYRDYQARVPKLVPVRIQWGADGYTIQTESYRATESLALQQEANDPRSASAHR